MRGVFQFSIRLLLADDYACKGIGLGSLYFKRPKETMFDLSFFRVFLAADANRETQRLRLKQVAAIFIW